MDRLPKEVAARLTTSHCDRQQRVGEETIDKRTILFLLGYTIKWTGMYDFVHVKKISGVNLYTLRVNDKI